MEKMNKIYLVEGSSGEYEDYRNWIVKGFYDEEKANKFSDLCMQFANSLKSKGYTYTDIPESEFINAPDPEFQLDFNISYIVFPVEVE